MVIIKIKCTLSAFHVLHKKTGVQGSTRGSKKRELQKQCLDARMNSIFLLCKKKDKMKYLSRELQDETVFVNKLRVI
jgi:hypothetical protein